MGVTIREVAELAGVSTATVSRVLNQDGRIREATRLKVLESVAQLNYKINNVARSLKISRTFTIGFITPEIANDFFMTIAQGVEDSLREEGYSVIICNSNEKNSEEEQRVNLLLEKCIDGMIIIPSNNHGDHFKILREMNIPFVFVDRMADDITSDAVLVDNEQGSFEAVRKLIERGYRNFGFIGGSSSLTPARERFQGFQAALKDYGIPIKEENLRFGNFHADSGYKLMKELYELDRSPEIIFIANYFMHVGAARFLFEQYRDQQPGIQIASFDDMDLSSITGFAKLTIAQPILEIGKEAARLLLARIRGEDIPFPCVRRLKTKLVLHDTSKTSTNKINRSIM